MTASAYPCPVFWRFTRRDGLREDSIDVPDGGLAASVFEHYASRFPRLGEMSRSIVLAVNQKFCAPSGSFVGWG